jgi:hypothetical protein
MYMRMGGGWGGGKAINSSQDTAICMWRGGGDGKIEGLYTQRGNTQYKVDKLHILHFPRELKDDNGRVIILDPLLGKTGEKERGSTTLQWWLRICLIRLGSQQLIGKRMNSLVCSAFERDCFREN